MMLGDAIGDEHFNQLFGSASCFLRAGGRTEATLPPIIDLKLTGRRRVIPKPLDKL
jgi:hypothetical protein